MNSRVCLCVLMAVLLAGVLAQPVPAEEPVDPGALQSEEPMLRREQRAVQRVDGDPRAHLGALLARYVQQARKGRYLIPPLQPPQPSTLSPTAGSPSIWRKEVGSKPSPLSRGHCWRSIKLKGDLGFLFTFL